MSAPATSLAAVPPLGPRRARVVVYVALALMVAGAAVGIAVPAGLEWDFGNFYDAGRRAAAGEIGSLYDTAAPIDGEAPHANMKFWGAPMSAFLYAPLAALPARAASAALKLEGTIAIFVSLGLLFGFLQQRVPDNPAERWRYAAVFAVLALAFQPFWTVYRVGGQTTPTVFLLLVLGLAAYAHGRDTLTMVLLAVAVLIKPAFVLVPAALALLGGWRVLLRATAVGLVIGVGSVALLGWDVHVEFARVVRDGMGLPKEWAYNSSLYVLFDNVRMSPLIDRWPAAVRTGVDAADVILRLGAIGFIIWLARLGRRLAPAGRERRTVDYLVALLAFLFVSQILWEHYLAALFPVLAAAWVVHRGLPRSAVHVLAAISVFALGQNLVVLQPFWFVIPMDQPLALIGTALFKSAPLLLTIWFLWRHGASWLGARPAAEGAPACR